MTRNDTAKQVLPLAALVVVVLLLDGCGFHARGAVELPDAMKVTVIEGALPNSAIATETRRALESAGGRVVTDPAEAAARLDIRDETVGRRLLSVSSEGRASEYQVSYRLTYRLLGHDGDLLVPDQTLRLTRDYAYDSASVLGSETEQRRLVEEMRKAGVRQMVRRLRLTLVAPGRQP